MASPEILAGCMVRLSSNMGLVLFVFRSFMLYVDMLIGRVYLDEFLTTSYGDMDFRQSCQPAVSGRLLPR
jgi:hypothetical protein